MNDYAFSDISSDFPPGYVDPDEDLVTTAQIVAQETDDLSKTILGKVFTIDFLLKHILNANLKRRGNLGIVSPDNTFVSNEQFWKGFYIEGQSRAFRWVRLESFQLTDWFPRSPGLSSTWEAEIILHKAQQHQQHMEVFGNIGVFAPHWKEEMVSLGGIGTIRFKPIKIEGDDFWLCTATSDGYCHSGVPLAIPNRLLESIDFGFNQFYNFVGQVQFLPEFIEHHFSHVRRVPQIYMRIEKIERVQKRQNKTRPVIITPTVFFQRYSGITGSAVFVTCNSNSIDELDRASDWIMRYVKQYKGEILTNFDQQRPAFEDVPFSLQKVMSGKLDRKQLSRAHIENPTIIINTIKNINAGILDKSNKDIKIGNNSTVFGGINMANDNQPIQVFLCHSSSDKSKVRELYRQLCKDGVNPWLDEENLLPGHDWQIEIPKAVRNSDVVIVCLSKESVTKEGYVQKEIKQALDVADEKPEGTIFIIPLRLEECDVPERLSKWHWVNLFDDSGYQRLMRALNTRAETKNKA